MNATTSTKKRDTLRAITKRRLTSLATHESCSGGVFFIDEIPSDGDNDTDDFSSEKIAGHNVTGTPHGCVAVKDLILGNTGVGKSFLCNILLGDDAFASKCQPCSCTDKIDVDCRKFDTTSLHVYNIPGLLEADQEKVVRNKKCIKKAFLDEPHLRTVVLFVFSVGNGGRIKGEDVAAWEAIEQFLQPHAKRCNAPIGFVEALLEGHGVSPQFVFSTPQTTLHAISLMRIFH